jgi:hypothetical protein
MLDPGPELERDAMGSAVRAQLTDLGVALVQGEMGTDRDLRARMNMARVIGEENKALGVFWLERDPAVLYFIAPPFEKLLSRGIGSSETEPSAIEEEVSVIVRSTVVALLQGEEVAMAAVEVPPPPQPKKEPAPVQPPPPPRARPAPRRLERLRVEAAYVGTSFAPSAPLQNGAGLGLVALPVSGLLVGARYTAVFPIEVRGDEVSLEINRHPAELSLGWELSVARLRLQAEIAGLVDYVTRSTATTSGGFQPQPDAEHLAFGVSPRLRALFAIFPVVYLFAGAGADVYSPRMAYVVESPTRQEILRSRLAQPWFAAGAAVRIW